MHFFVQLVIAAFAVPAAAAAVQQEDVSDFVQAAAPATGFAFVLEAEIVVAVAVVSVSRP